MIAAHAARRGAVPGAALGAVGAALIALPFVDPEIFHLRVLTGIFVQAAMAGSWNLLGGYTGYINFGHAAFFGIGVFTVAILSQALGGTPLWLLPAGAALAGAFALLVGYPTLRIRGPHFAVATLILALMGEIFVGNLDRITGGGLGIVMPRPAGTPLEIERRFYLAFGALAAIAALAARWVEGSALGYTLQAIREDEDAARAVGIRAARYKMLMLCLSACGAGAVGGLYGSYVGYISPDGAFNLAFSVNPVVYTVIGGLGTWAGPLIGSGLMEILSTALTLLSPTLKAISQVLFGAILIAVVLLAPQGIVGWLAQRRDAVLRARLKAAHG